MAKNPGPTARRPWQVLVRLPVAPPSAELQQRFEAEGQDVPSEMWGNEIYVVVVRRTAEGHVGSMSIRRRDRRSPRDWRHFQAIKDQLAGPDAEAVELYPAQNRLVDTANQFWLWCLPPGERFPLGFNERRVRDAVSEQDETGAAQRPFDDG